MKKKIQNGRLKKSAFFKIANSQNFFLKISWIGPWISRIDRCEGHWFISTYIWTMPIMMFSPVTNLMHHPLYIEWQMYQPEYIFFALRSYWFLKKKKIRESRPKISVRGNRASGDGIVLEQGVFSCSKIYYPISSCFSLKNPKKHTYWSSKYFRFFPSWQRFCDAFLWGPTLIGMGRPVLLTICCRMFFCRIFFFCKHFSKDTKVHLGGTYVHFLLCLLHS